jgi:WD40 repeat protein
MLLRWLILLTVPSFASAEPAPRTDAHGDPLPPFARARLGTQRLWHGYHTTAIAFSPDGKTLVTAGDDLRLWDVATGKELRRFRNPGDRLKSLDFAGDGRTLIGAGTYTPAVYMIDIHTGKLRHRIGEAPRGREVVGVDDTNEVRPIAVLADGHTLAAPFREERRSAGPDGGTVHHRPHQCVRWYDASSGKLLGETSLEGTWSDPQFIAVTQDGKTLACVGEGHVVNVWDRASAKRLRRLGAREHWTLCGAFSGDGKMLATGGMDQRVRLWDVATGRPVRELTGHETSVRSVHYLPDGTTLLSVSRDRIRLWESGTGKLIREFRPPRDSIQAAALSARGTHVAAAAYEGTVVVWDIATGRELHAFQGHRARVNALAFSRDGRTLVSGGGDTVLLWDAVGRTVRRRLGERGTTAERLAFLPDGKTLVVGDSHRPPELWEVGGGRRLRAIRGPQ